MQVVNIANLKNTHREVKCPNGGFTSLRILLKKDKMGYTLTHTTIHKGQPQRWHYKNHLEACYCVSGSGTLLDVSKNKSFSISPGVTYVLDKNDEHIFQAHEETVLMCVFNPPLKGQEVHKKDGSYKL